jgi:hypothetical protein
METAPLPSRRSAAVGFVLLLPTLAFMAANILVYEFGVRSLVGSLWVFEPWPVQGLIVLGPLAALLLNGLSVLRLRLRREPGSLVGRVTVRLSAPHLAVLVVGAALLAAMALYLVGENLPCLLGRQPTC